MKPNKTRKRRTPPPPIPRAWIVSGPFFFARIPAWRGVSGVALRVAPRPDAPNQPVSRPAQSFFSARFGLSQAHDYEFEFIHPFADGNGRMGRLWQSLILARWNPPFAGIPVERLIFEH